MPTRTPTRTGATPAHQKLDVFVGSWDTTGEVRTKDTTAPAPYSARDRYEWLPGGYFMLHWVDADMPDGKVEGIEILGYDVESGTYPIQTYDNAGATGDLTGRVDGATWTFTAEAESVRFTGSFTPDGKTLAGHWENRENASSPWREWITVRLTRAAAATG